MRALAVVAIAVLIVSGAVVLWDSTATFHESVPSHSSLVVKATARWKGSSTVVAAHRARALTYLCVAESDGLASVRRFEWVRDGAFRFTVVPTLDGADRRQLTGCLSDIRMPRLLVSVDRMQSSPMKEPSQ